MNIFIYGKQTRMTTSIKANHYAWLGRKHWTVFFFFFKLKLTVTPKETLEGRGEGLST